MLAAHGRWFEVMDRSLVSETIALEREALLNLLRTTYRGARLAVAERVSSMTRMPVTLASEVFVLSPIPTP
jgi:hypothetical protein